MSIATNASTASSQPQARVASRSLPSAATLVAVFMAAAALVSTVLWRRLYEWYGLYENLPKPYYSFEKAKDWFDSPALRQTLLMFIVLGAMYAAAIVLVQAGTRINLATKLGIVALALGPAIYNVLLFPVGALDVFNYMIELKLAFHYDKNPYLVTFQDYVGDSYTRSAFLTNVFLFYGPAWLILSGMPAVIAGFDDIAQTLIALKVFNLLLIAATAAVIAWHHRDTRTRWLAVVLFAANPLVLFEGIANGHNDVLLTAFVISAMVALQRKSPLAGPLLALSALVKLYTVALVPIFVIVALKGHWGRRKVATTVALTVVAVVVTCTPFWGEGRLVDGLRAGLEESQEMDHVSPLSLVRQYAQNEEAHERPDTEFALSRPSFEIVPPETQASIDRWFTIIFAVGALLIAFSVWRGRSPELAAAETLLLLFLCLTNLYPWYLVPVFALLAMRPDRLARIYAVVATVLGLVYYPMFVYGHYNSGWSRFQIHQFLALFLTLPILLYLFARLIPWGRFVAPTADTAPVNR
jgi:hypothetical protein